MVGDVATLHARQRTRACMRDLTADYHGGAADLLRRRRIQIEEIVIMAANSRPITFAPSRTALPALLLIAFMAPAAHAQPTITNLGLLPDTTESSATGLSADASVVVGYCVIDRIEGNSLAFRWTSAGGLQDLGG